MGVSNPPRRFVPPNVATRLPALAGVEDMDFNSRAEKRQQCCQGLVEGHGANPA